MTSRKTPLVQSIHDRLKRAAGERREDFTATLVRYGNERFLYRLSRTRHAGRFVLKGAMLFLLWLGRYHRPTRDMDLLGIGEVTEDGMREVFTDVCTVNVEDDALAFDPGTIAVHEIREEQAYQGLRVTLQGRLGRSRINIQVDVGMGDAVTPEPTEADYPTLLDQPAPRIKVYPPVTVVAEKLEAMLRLGARNSRMKDFFDVWLMSRSLEFAGAALSEAIRRTCERRRTPIETEPACFTEEFGNDASRHVQWNAFIHRGRLSDAPTSFSEVMERIRVFLHPVIAVLAQGAAFSLHWPAGGPWRCAPARE